MTHAVLSPGRDLIDETARLLVGGPTSKDYSQNLVVFPGKRPAHFLRKKMAEREGSPYLPPLVLSMEEFMDRMYGQMCGQGHRKLETIDAIAFLFELHRAMASPMGGGSFLSLEAFFPMGLRIYRDLEELVIEGVDRGRVSLLGPDMEGAIPPETGARLQSLSYFLERFYPLIEEAGFSSRSQRYNLVSRDLSRGDLPWERIVFAGFYGLTASEKRLFRKMRTWPDTYLLFQRGPRIRNQLLQLGLDCEEGADDEHGVEPRVHFHKSPDVHGQIFALSGLLKEQMDRIEDAPCQECCGHALDRTVIVLPSPETLFAVLYHALPALAKEDYNVSLGYPLERTPTWGFLTSLVQLLMSTSADRYYIPDYLDFVLHPYTKNVYLHGRSETTRIMFHALEERLLAARAKGFISLEEMEEDDTFFEQVQDMVSDTEGELLPGAIKEHLTTIHNELIRRAVSFDNIGDFAAKLAAVLSFVYDHSSARLHPFFHPFAESFLEQLHLLKNSRVKDLSFSDRGGYFRFLRRYVSHCLTPFEGTPLRGLQVLGFLETRSLNFDRVYVLDANEETIPDGNRADTFIPVSIRRAMALPTQRDRDEQSAYYFRTLVTGAKEVHLFYVESDKKEKSRFVERLLWERQVKEGARDSSAYVSSLSYRLSLEASQPRPVTKSAAVTQFLGSRLFDATSIDTYLRCPLQFYHRYVLGLSKRGDNGEDVERVDIGRLIHRILCAFFERRKDVPLTDTDMDTTEMDALVHAMFSKVYGADPAGAVYLLKQQILRQMKTFLGKYMIPLVNRAPVRIIGLEQKIETNYQGFRFQGILDRIDLRGDRTYVIDYKSGGSARRLAIDFTRLDPNDRESWAGAVGSIQLPLYLLLHREAHHGAADSNCMFLLLGKAHLDDSIELPLFDEKTDRGWAYEALKKVIVGLTREIVSPDFAFDPGLRAEGACGFCDYRYLCGTQWQTR